MTTTSRAEPEQVRTIDFRDRKIDVLFPDMEKLLVIKRTVARLESVGEEGWTAPAVLKAAERVHTFVESILLNPGDRDWIEDEVLEGRMTLPDTMQILLLTVEAFKGEQSTSTPEAKPVRRRTTRRKAS